MFGISILFVIILHGQAKEKHIVNFEQHWTNPARLFSFVVYKKCIITHAHVLILKVITEDDDPKCRLQSFVPRTIVTVQ